MTDRYVLIGQTPVPEPDLFAWARWFEGNDRHVALTEVGPYTVSTVFLGLDHGWGKGPPLIFETMIFHIGESRTEDYQERCSTWLEAEEQHRRAVEWAEKAMLSGSRDETT